MKKGRNGGYTLVELIMVVVIISLLTSIAVPRFDLILVKANQSNAKLNLGTLRSVINVYFTSTDGNYPLSGFPAGDLHYTANGLSLSTVIAPFFTNTILTPKLMDRNPSYNALGVNYDSEASRLMELTPPKDVFIVFGAPAYTPMLNSPYAYDNRNGTIYISNGNYDSKGNYFYTW